MKSAKELLMEYWLLFSTAAKAAALFVPDGVLELPYLESIHVRPRAEGPEAIEKFIGSLMSVIPDWKFTNTRIFMEDGNQVFAEYEIHVKTV
jgi:SnoaL-like domain